MLFLNLMIRFNDPKIRILSKQNLHFWVKHPSILFYSILKPKLTPSIFLTLSQFILYSLENSNKI